MPATYGDGFRAALQTLGVGAAELAPDGTVLAANARFCDIIGLPIDVVRGTSLDRLLAVKMGDLAATTAAGRTTDTPLQRRDGGATAWIRSSLAPVHDPSSGGVTSFLLVVTDVTPLKAVEQRMTSGAHSTRGRREVGGRLINALEAERSRIARELHDDIGQSLAVLVIQMLRAGKPVSGTSGRKHADIPELAARVQEIAARVGRLSHELHSSRLEYLGLEKTIRGACADFSKGNPMAVECVCDAVPPEIDSGIGLCVFRIVQEALHNVAKHSRGTRVKVELTGRPDGLAVAVEDDGVGFDVVEASMAEGIGLISMRERVAFVGGTFDLSSAPGRGTRIEARVPLPASVR